MKQALLRFTPKGIYCPQGEFYIDPWLPVNKALITHAHTDHAYRGHRLYLAHRQSIPILKHRLGKPGFRFQEVEYNESLSINGVKVSFHPAGHIAGSAQIRVEKEGQVWVVSGDYKLENDGISTPFEPIKCDVFITESTFGLPCFQWEPQQIIFDAINDWWRHNRSQGVTSILVGYALGKAQRLLKGVDSSIGPIYGHGSIINLTEIIRLFHPWLPPLLKVTADVAQKDLTGSLILAPPSVMQHPWLNRFHPYRLGYVSGWMSLRNLQKRKGVDTGFILSDHADWIALQQAIKATEAKKIIVTHGFTEIFAYWLAQQGYDAHEAHTEYGAETNEDED